MTESDKTGRNIAASVRARLLNKARAERLDFNLLITRYALEPMTLAVVIEALREFLLPVLAAFAAGNGFDRQWRAGAGWDRIK